MADRDLRLVLGEGDAGDDLLFHDILLVADERARRRAVRIDVLGLVEARAHEDAHLVHHAELDRAHLQHLGAERGKFEHFLERDLVQPLGARHHARVGGVDAVDVGVDVAAVGLDGGGDRDRRRVGAAAPERGDAAGLLVDALEAGDDRDLLALRKRLISSAPLTSRMRAEPWALEVRIGNCQPCQERALMPMPSSMIARRPAVTCSPEATTASYSRASCSSEASRHQPTSWLVVPDMAETTTATSWPASTSRLTWRATLPMRSMSATEVPPNFITSRAMEADASLQFRDIDGASPLRAPAKKAAIHTGGVCGLQPRRPINHRRAANGLKAERQSASTVDPAEVERFSALAAAWWDPRGKMAPLHKFNPVRLGYIRDQAVDRFGRDAKRLDCLKGLRILDIGCGGGILSEPLARLGATWWAPIRPRTISRRRSSMRRRPSLRSITAAPPPKRWPTPASVRPRAGHGGGRACHRRDAVRRALRRDGEARRADDRRHDQSHA